ncbi:flagellar assembly peptidoglycan hydrolase FlgJ [Massilia violaceinigra]|uniref:Flagellar assembly peptidoglycan hydrolase FlgJ n=1 Tax=Massilia violaceinigra TaxID=2045208 RepID=A0A2D2DI44_9BURK|nr:glucosaminidase domain-containing protein [Massilia violaceinigra]ATQ74646.1 flagellar assembly peptidoglycan hydrolase FlgJ [Massilia violaceinigra]
MRHADFHTASITPATPTQSTRPMAAVGGGAGFGGVYSSMQNEIADFISQGSADSGASMLSPQGRMLQARLQDAEVAPASTVGGAFADGSEQQAFLEQIAPWAREAGERLGVAPQLVSAHAALESGWGQRPLRQAEGATTHNLFGIKAGASWQGEVADNATTEYEHGAAVKKTERFRSYPDQGAAFRDYAQVLLDNPRYAAAIGTGTDARAFAEGLAKGGYATDPAYAAKLTRLAARLQGASE